MNIFVFDDVDILLLTSLGVFFIIQFIFYFTIYRKVYTQRKVAKSNLLTYETEYPPLSVIMYANGESDNLKRNLPLILEQDYPKFEVIVVSDGLSENDEDVLCLMERSYSHFYHTFVPDGSKYLSREKLAVTMGIKASKYDWIVMTNPDCFPAGKNWLRLMARNFTPATDIVLGYSGFEYKKGWRQLLVAFDNFFFSLRYLGFAIMKRPYMGIGRNLAYRKEVFFKQKGFSSQLNLRMGYDDLFINGIANSNNTRVETDNEAKINIQPLNTKKEWRESKINYQVTSRLFRGKQRYWLGFETFSCIFFYLLVIGVIVKGAYMQHWIVLGIGVLIYLLRFLFQVIVINQNARALNERRLYLSLPVFDILIPLYALRFKLSRFFSKRRNFMGR